MPIRSLAALLVFALVAACTTVATADTGGPPVPAVVAAGPDAGLAVDVDVDAVTGASPNQPAIEVRDPVADPGGAYAALREAKRLGLWVAVAYGLLVVSGAYRARMQPKPGVSLDPRSWSARSLALSSALVAVCGPLVEVGAGTAGWGPVVTGGAYAVAIVRDAFDPPRGAARKAEA